MLFFFRMTLTLFFLNMASACGVENPFQSSIEEVKGVQDVIAEFREPTQTFLLVIGCGRSGTTYMTKVLSASGFDVKHEWMGEQGSVSWLMTPGDADWAPWGPLSKDYQFEHILHQVRDPVKVIQSVYNVPPSATWEWVGIFIPEIKPGDSKLAKSAKYWYYWNLIAESRAEFTYRIEDFNADYQIVGDKIGVVFDKSVIKSISKKTKTQRRIGHRQITWKILKDELDADLFDKVRSLALRYGYTPDQDKQDRQ